MAFWTAADLAQLKAFAESGMTSQCYVLSQNSGGGLVKDGAGGVTSTSAGGGKTTAAAVHAAITQPASGTTVVTTAITNPAGPSRITVTGNQASCTGGVLVEGTDENGVAATETIAAAGTSTVLGALVFATVTRITIPARGAAGDALSIGHAIKCRWKTRDRQPTEGSASGQTDSRLRVEVYMPLWAVVKTSDQIKVVGGPLIEIQGHDVGATDAVQISVDGVLIS